MIHFDVATVRDRERLAYWHEELCRTYCRASTKVLKPGTFNGQLARTHLGSLEVSDIDCDPTHYKRQAIDVREALSEDFLLSVLREGEGQLSQRDRDALQRPGDIVIYDTARALVL